LKIKGSKVKKGEKPVAEANNAAENVPVQKWNTGIV